MSYVCEHSVGTDRRCDFRSGKVILQQEIAPAQMRKLLAEGRTDPFDGFVSARTRRKFKASLVCEPGGKIGFEFAPRPARPGATAKSGAAKAPEASAEKPAARSAATTGAARSRAAMPSIDEAEGDVSVKERAVKPKAAPSRRTGGKRS
jgi:DNA topoisomerase-3